MTSTSMDECAQKLRLYIGSISQELYDDQVQLTSRLSKFGTIVSELEIHQKPTALTYFAYINIEITPKNLTKLKQHLNGVNFKNSKLVIDIAAKTFKQKWQEDQLKVDTKEEDRIKREKIARARQERILHGKDELVVKGRIRKTPRKNLKSLTLRCYINGKPVQFRNNKTKVWGYDKTRKLRDLTWLFEKNEWKDGNFHIIERAAVRSTAKVENEIEETFEVEKDTNNKILSSLFESFDFDKPIEFKEAEREEESGDSDYEFEASFNARDSYDVKVKDCDGASNAIEEYKKAHPIPALSAVTDEEEEPSNGDKQMEQEEHIEEDREVPEDSDLDDEFIPTFGKPVAEVEPVSAKTNETEHLRDLFNPEASTSFKLQDSDVDDEGPAAVGIDEAEKQEILQQQLQKKQIMNAVTNKSLFFHHAESPFLASQSQLNRISRDFNKEEYETWFYEKRGELNREFKRYKRDYVRQFNKKKH